MFGFGYYSFHYWDFSYVLVIIAMGFALWASFRVKSVFRKYSRIPSASGMTGAEAAKRVLEHNGIRDVRIERVSGDLTDHYDPGSNVIRLSDSVYNATSPAAIGVAAHEAGHAVQYARNYMPIKLRNAIIPITNFGSMIAVPLVLLGLFLSYMSHFMIIFAYIGIVAFTLSVVFQLLTLPTEFDASHRAIATLRNSNMLYGEEMGAVKKVLTAAALTYVAALAVSVTQLLRLLMLVNRRD